ncbi:MAG: transporter substrate-binding domain-containing protein, partial [Solirubrobacteraceae bacterium]|nr:transporter substrate-binding domain-containing protein [Solirubrobacteraceae bacterium]
GFDGIIAALQAKKCDAIISSLTNSPERAKEIAFVDYAQFGLALLVKKGTTGIDTVEALSGKTVAVQVGTTTKQALEAESKKIEAAGNPAIKVQTFPKDTDAANALRTDKVDAYLTDAPPAAYFVKQAPDDFELAATPQIEPAPVGIGIRQDDAELKTALQTGIDAMTEDGKLLEILEKWELGDFMLSGQ